jgi:hypothetical protein
MGRESEATMPNPADWCGGEKNRRKLKLSVILDYDKCKRTNYNRELSRRVTEICAWVGDTRYVYQFMYDMNVYGVGDATAYLEAFAVKNHKLERVQDKLNKLRAFISDLYGMMIPQ